MRSPEHIPEGAGPWRLLWSAFIGSGIVVFSIAGVVGTLIAWKVLASETISAFWFFVTFSVACIIFTTFAHAYIIACSRMRSVTPKALRGQSPHPPYNKCEAIVLITASELLSTGVSVAIYHIEEKSYERPLGFGTVANVQANGYVLVTLDVSFPELSNIVDKIKQNDGSVLGDLIVRPQIFRRDADMLMQVAKPGDVRWA